MQLTLTVQAGGGESKVDEQERQFDRFPIVIGRASTCDYCLDDASRYISSNHASILYEDGQLYIEDTSANGTYLNGASEPVGRDQRTLLRNGDSLTIGDYEIGVTIYDPRAEAVTVESTASEAEVCSWFSAVEQQGSQRTDDDDFVDTTADFTADTSTDNGTEIQPESEAAECGLPVDAHPAATDALVLAELDFDLARLDVVLPDPEAADPEAAVSSTSAADAGRPDVAGRKSVEPDTPEPDTPEPDVPEIDPAGKSRRPSIRRRLRSARQAAANSAEQTPLAEVGTMPASAEHVSSEMPADQAAPASTDIPAAADATTRRTTTAPDLTAIVGDRTDAIDALLESAGIDPAAVAGADREQIARQAGVLLNIAVTGLLQLLKSRSNVKQAINLDVTQLGSVENNPLKFAACTEDALAMLLRGATDQGYLGSEDAMYEAIDDVQMHQVAMLEGMKAAVRSLLHEFDPSELESTLANAHPFAAVVPITREARLWSQFCEHYDDISNAAMHGFNDLFGREFRRAYERRLEARRQRQTR